MGRPGNDLDALLPTVLSIVALLALEFAGPLYAERFRSGTPWHAHHIAERYGLLTIIALGEGLIGTVAAVQAIRAESGWTLNLALLVFAGVAMAFGIWWLYFAIPFAELLHRRPNRSFGWGYGQLPVIAAVVAVGAGLHVAAYLIEHHSELTATQTAVTVAIPLAVFIVGLIGLYSYITGTIDGFHAVLLLTSIACLVVGVLLAGSAGMVWSLVVLALAPWIGVLGFELRGHRDLEATLAED